MKGFTEQWLRDNADRIASDNRSEAADTDETASKRTARGETPPQRMNGVEARYAGRLRADDSVAWWSFETFGVRVAKSCFYYPDFLVMRDDGALEIHEVKGSYIREDAKVKFRAATEVVPVVRWMMWVYEDGGWNCHLDLP